MMPLLKLSCHSTAPAAWLADESFPFPKCLTGRRRPTVFFSFLFISVGLKDGGKEIDAV
jgi:hypothetical protein